MRRRLIVDRFAQALSESGMCGDFPESCKKIWRYLEATQIKTDERERYKYFRHISKVGWVPHGRRFLVLNLILVLILMSSFEFEFNFDVGLDFDVDFGCDFECNFDFEIG